MSFTEEDLEYYEHGLDCKEADLEAVPGHGDLVWCDACQGYFYKDTKKPLPIMNNRFT